MDLESGATIYVEATIGGRVRLETIYGDSRMYTGLTTEEARTLANALLAAVVEAEAHTL